MKLLIDIPKELEQHFQKDGFNDSLMRLSMDANCLAGLYEQETALMLCEAFRNAVPVPAHGDLIDRDDFFATCPELVDGYKRITDDLVVIPAGESENKK